MRTGRDDLLHVVLCERLDVGFRLLLEQVFVAETACRITCAGLLIAQHGKIDPRLFQHRRHRTRRVHSALDQCARAADPEQHLRFWLFSEGRDIEPIHPRGAGEGRAPPRMTALFDRLQGRLRGIGGTGLFQREEPAHVDDRVDMVDLDRTGLETGRTCQAIPEHFVAYSVVDHRRGRGRRGLPGRGAEQNRTAFLHIPAHVLDQLPRGKRFAR